MNTIDHLTEIPAELKALPNWVAWKLVERDGSLTKPPFIVGTNRHASSTDPSTWTTYEAAIASVAATGIGKENGLGFAIGGAALDLNLIAIDIDGCRDTDGTIAPWADELLTAAGGYTEIILRRLVCASLAQANYAKIRRRSTSIPPPDSARKLRSSASQIGNTSR